MYYMYYGFNWNRQQLLEYLIKECDLHLAEAGLSKYQVSLNAWSVANLKPMSHPERVARTQV